MTLFESCLDRYVVDTESECWLWQGSKARGGYGTVFYGRRCHRVHRVLFEHYYGPIPPGMYACHTCDTPSCVNPEHIFLGTAKDNALDAIRKGRMSTRKAVTKFVAKSLERNTCRRGHPYTDDNLYLRREGGRRCLICKRMRDRKYTKRKAMQRAAA